MLTVLLLRCHCKFLLGRVVYLLVSLTQGPEVPGSIRGPANYFDSFLLSLIQEKRLSVTGESLCT